MPTMRLAQTEVGHTLAFVIDDFGLSCQSLLSVRGALKKFVDEGMRPADVVAFRHTGRTLGALQHFTSDKRLLEAAVAAGRGPATRVTWVRAGGTYSLGGLEPGFYVIQIAVREKAASGKSRAVGEWIDFEIRD